MMLYSAECCTECVMNGDCLLQSNGDVEDCDIYKKSQEKKQ